MQNGSLLSESLEYTDSSEVFSQSMYRAGLPERSFTYSYDSRHQLVDAKEELIGDYRAAFSYSDAGRLLSVDPLAGVIAGRDSLVYSHGDGSLAGADFHAPVDLLGSEKELHYSYDASGNVVTRQEVTDPGGVADTAEWDFSYDGVSQQREVLLNNGAGGRELYYYDDAGQRYMTVTYAQKGEAVPERVRIWMGGAEIWFEQNSSGELEVATEYGYLSLGNVNIGRIKEDVLGVTTEATFANGLSHIMGALNWDTGVVNAAYIYGPYGKLVDSAGPEQDDHLRRFNGKESDQLSKLSYYGYRYYDEQSLAWTQADPLYLFAPDLSGDNPREMSLYTFSLNNPVRYMDPDGLSGEERMPKCGAECGNRPGGVDLGKWFSDWWNTDTSGLDWEVGRKTAQGAYAITNGLMAQANAAPSLPMAPTGIGYQLVKKARITLTGNKLSQLYFIGLINRLASVSPEAQTYFNDMLIGSKNRPNNITINLVWNDPTVAVDQYFSGKLNIDDLMPETSSGKDLRRAMHVIVEYWETQSHLAATNPTANDRLIRGAGMSIYIQGHNAAVTFDRQYLQRTLKLRQLPYKGPKLRKYKHWSFQ